MVAFWSIGEYFKSQFSESCLVKSFIKGKIELRQNNFKQFSHGEICLKTKYKV